MAALLLRDPHLEVCPDFDSEPFEPMRTLLRNTGLTDEQAIDALRDAWVTRNNQLRDRWTQEAEAREAAAEAAAQQQQQQEEEEQARREQEARMQQQLQQQQAPPNDQEGAEVQQDLGGEDQRRPKPKLRSFDPNLSVASVIVPRPSSYAINKLANFEYCELWYFTQEGCEDAQRSQRSEADDAFGMAKLGEMVMLRPVASVQASKRVVQDADLSWEQFHYAQRSFVEYLLKASWPEEHAQSLVRFFVHLENSPYINRENGKKIILTYQARVRRNWMDMMKQSDGAVFNIALINNDLMEAITRDLQSVTTGDLHRQVSKPSLLIPASSLIITSLSLPILPPLRYLMLRNTPLLCYTASPRHHSLPLHLRATHRPLPPLSPTSLPHATPRRMPPLATRIAQYLTHHATRCMRYLPHPSPLPATSLTPLHATPATCHIRLMPHTHPATDRMPHVTAHVTCYTLHALPATRLPHHLPRIAHHCARHLATPTPRTSSTAPASLPLTPPPLLPLY